MIWANRWSPTGHPRSTLWGRQPMARWTEASRFLVALSTHLGFPPSPGAGYKGVCLSGGVMVGTFIQSDENVWPVRPFGGK